MHTSLATVDALAKQLIEASIAPNTKRSYRASCSDYVDYAADRARPLESPRTVVAWLTERSTATWQNPKNKKPAPPMKASALATALAGVSWMFRCILPPESPNPASAPEVQMVLRGLKRAAPQAPREAKPLAIEDIMRALPSLNLRDQALVLVGFATGMRRSNLVEIRVEDLEFTEEGVVINIRKSKTDQEGLGHQVAIPYGKKVCPVSILKAYLAKYAITEGFVFRSMRKGDRITNDRLSPEKVSKIVKAVAKAIGLDSEDFSGHTLRSSFVTAAAKAHVPIEDIMRVTSHKSVEMVTKYIRRAQMFEDHPLDKML